MNLSFLVADNTDRACAVVHFVIISPSYSSTSDTLRKMNKIEILKTKSIPFLLLVEVEMLQFSFFVLSNKTVSCALIGYPTGHARCGYLARSGFPAMSRKKNDVITFI